MNVRETIEINTPEFLALCKSHKVKNLYAFGWSIGPNFDENRSDVDLLVELNEEDPVERGIKLMELWDKFESFFQRKVDLLTSSSIKNPILRKSIERTQVLIYDGKGQKVSI